MTLWRRIEPVDICIFRGNRLFGSPGTLADSLMPPWPSVFSGALRSRMLVDRGVDLAEYAGGRRPEGPLGEVLGTPEAPGSFAVGAVALWQGREKRAVFPLPQDLRVRVPEGEGASPVVSRLEAVPWSEGGMLGGQSFLPRVLADRSGRLEKPRGEYWITAEGLRRYLEGRCPDARHLVGAGHLWKWDSRLGIGLSDERRTVEEGLLYTAETVAMEPGTAFLVEVRGCPEELLPRDGLVRLGGDGRGAHLSPAEPPLAEPLPPPGTPFFLMAATPGLFPGGGWLPGLKREAGEWWLHWEQVRARLVAVALGRPVTVSGWDLASHRPRPAQRAVAPGAVYFFDRVEGRAEDPTRQMWKALLEEAPDPQRGLWLQRKAEGFGRLLAGQWNG